MSITMQLKAILRLAPHQRERLAATLGVSCSTIDRWANGSANPTPRHLTALERTIASFADDLLTDGAERALAAALSAAREIMHKHGGASSRNDALDQISLLLICHLKQIRTGEAGLHRLPATDVSKALAEAVSSLEPETSAGVAAAFDRCAKTLLSKPVFLGDLIGALAPALTELESVSEGGKWNNFHELFVSFLSSSFHEEKEFAQYMTPREVSDFMTRVGLSLVSTRHTHPVVIDPSCGTASFLTDFADLYAAHLSNASGHGAGERWLQEDAPETIIGVDTSERMIRLASASFVAEGLLPKRLYLDSALQPSTVAVQELLRPNVADLIITNPPFGAEHSKGGHGGGRLTSELLFVESYVEWMKPGGFALTIIPDSVLTNKGVFEATRARLLEKVDIIAVISLPAVTFAASGTTTKTSILIMQKRERQRPPQATFFAVVDGVGFQVSSRGSVRKRVRQGENQLPGVADSLLFKNDEASIGHRHQLSPDARRWDAQFWNSPMSKGSSTNASGTEISKLGTFAQLVAERVDPKRLPGPTFRYIEISSVDGDLLRVSSSEVPNLAAPSRARRRVRAGDVLISTVRPDRRTIGVVPPSLDGAVCSTGFAVLRSKSVSPYVLAAALRSASVTEQLVGVSAGVAYPVFDPEALEDVELELGDRQWQDDCEQYGAALQVLEALHGSLLAA